MNNASMKEVMMAENRRREMRKVESCIYTATLLNLGYETTLRRKIYCKELLAVLHRDG